MTYNTIVADPPWQLQRNRGTWPNGAGSSDFRTEDLDYQTMTVEAIAALPVAAMVSADAHLYLWTTQRYLRAAYDVAERWGFSVSTPLVWSKPPKGIGGGAFIPSAEFVLFCRRGNLPTKARHLGTVFQWSRPKGHSTKPDAFLDLVERMSPGPYLEMFARRNRLGWDTWGNEALEHVQLEAV